MKTLFSLSDFPLPPIGQTVIIKIADLVLLPYISLYLIASGGYYGFHFVTPPPPQCVERFHRYRSNEKNIIATLLRFAGYIHTIKLPGNIFGLILKNKMAATDISLSVMKIAYISLIIDLRVLGW